MRVLALDIWEDLRRKRLWLVALGLVVAILAVVFLALRAGSGEAPVPPPTATDPGAASPAADVSLIDEPLGGSSDLQNFEPRDPFAGGAASAAGLGAAGATAGGLGSATGGSGDVSSGAGSGLSGDVSTEPPSTDVGSGGGGTLSTGSTASPSGSSGSPPAPPSDSSGSPPAPRSGSSGSTDGSGIGDKRPRDGDKPEQKQPKREVEYFSHEVDLFFGRRGSTREYEGLPALSLLPKSNPLLFLAGVSADGKVAVFSVLDHDFEGDGGCPKGLARCSLLYLEKGDKRTISDGEGNSYTLRLGAISRVKLDG